MEIIVCGRPEEARCCEQILVDIAKKYLEPIDIKLMSSGKQVLFHIDSKNTDVDLIYLEYDLEDGNGIEVADALRQKGVTSDIVFYTTDEKHIDQGYDVDALHYLVKNRVTDVKFEKVFLKAMARAKKRNEEVLSLFCAGENRRIEISSILYFEVNRRIVSVHYGEGEIFEFYSTLSRLEEILFGKGFLRIHQSFLISEKHIEKKNKKTVTMTDKSVLPIGRSYQSKI